MPDSILVAFQDELYWYLGDLDNPNEQAPIALLAHCDRDGNFLTECAFEESYAYYFPKKGVLRHGVKIGDFSDLKRVGDHP
jgi:hypothetical protein